MVTSPCVSAFHLTLLLVSVLAHALLGGNLQSRRSSMRACLFWITVWIALCSAALAAFSPCVWKHCVAGLQLAALHMLPLATMPDHTLHDQASVQLAQPKATHGRLCLQHCA